MASTLEFDAASLAHQPDPDWDAGELDMGAERPWEPPRARAAARERPWVRVGFAVGTSLALIELIILLVAPAAPDSASRPSVAAELPAPAAAAARAEGERERAPVPSLAATAPARDLTLASGDPSAQVQATRGPRLPLPVFLDRAQGDGGSDTASHGPAAPSSSDAATERGGLASASPAPAPAPARAAMADAAAAAEAPQPKRAPQPEQQPGEGSKLGPELGPEPGPEPAELPGPDEVPGITPQAQPGLPYEQLPE